MRLYSVMFVLAGIIVLLAWGIIALQNRSYAKCSEDVVAIITYKRSIKGKNNHRYEFSAKYTVDGTEYEKTVTGVFSEYKSLEIGDPMELMYKPDNPKKAIRADRLEQKNASIVFIMGAALIVVGVVMFFV